MGQCYAERPVTLPKHQRHNTLNDRLARIGTISAGMPEFGDIISWSDRLGKSYLRTFTDVAGHFWLEQNADKASKWAKLARESHQLAWEFDHPGGSYTGRLLIDGEIYTSGEATRKFLNSHPAESPNTPKLE
jgi:hypothetical protein